MVRLGEAELVESTAGAQENVKIGGKDYALDLNIAADPLAGLSFDVATANLQYGLANIATLGGSACVGVDVASMTKAKMNGVFMVTIP